MSAEAPVRSMIPISAIVLTFNSEASIGRTLRSLSGLTNDIHIVDSFSTDRTLEICQSFGCQIKQRPFSNYSDQRNWAIDNLDLAHEWQLHLDADEEMTSELVRDIQGIDLNGPIDGYIVGRKIVFLGRVLRFGGVAKTWHYRLFRTGFGRCEDRLYDQHFVARGRVRKIASFMLDHQEASLSDWTVRHNRWSDMETDEMLQANTQTEGQIRPRLVGSAIERKRYAKGRYYRFPLFWRAMGYAFFRYLVQLGFLDGYRGLIYHMLQGFWFRFLVDAKIYEARLKAPCRCL